MRWTQTKQEAQFFGVNYTVPFAYGYRSHLALGQDLEKAIDEDVYHMARLGFNAFRVHVWDTEISDSTGNLLQNEHLRLFDYLIQKLKERNIKILITPIAFWGPGYPEPDQPTAGFSSRYNKQEAVTKEEAIRAQERYLEQFFQHINPYTGLSYQNDPDVIAAEINNEPHHTGPKEKTTEYINRTVAAVRKAGFTKPIFYNISESPRYADAVAPAPIQGVSFQWYPTGLVANRSLQGNFLPHVAQYSIPFDTIPAYANKARMVYEFDAGDVMEPFMYPAMARSFRTAGFQWATQFAYDPLATAHANTEYQTHYVNLAYTPAKAISLMIAGKAFNRLPRGKNWGGYPADTLFDVFRLSYREGLSEMNSPEEFYYTGNTRSRPVNLAKLRQLAGLGSSPVVRYSGTGAYFLDKLEKGVWRLEVMPDAILLRDPYGKASPSREVSRLSWQEQQLQILLPDLSPAFHIEGLNEGNQFSASTQDGRLRLRPGTYLLRKNAAAARKIPEQVRGVIGLAEFVAPQPRSTSPFVAHTPFREVSAGRPFELEAQIVGIDSTAKVEVLLRTFSGVWKNLPMQPRSAYTYRAEIPAELSLPGLISYRIMVQQANGETRTFPGNQPGNPWAWDYVEGESWETYVAAAGSALVLFDAGTDRTPLVFPNLWRSSERQLLTTDRPGQLLLRLALTALPKEGVLGWQLPLADKLAGRQEELSSFTKLLVKARSDSPMPQRLKVSLISREAASYATYVELTDHLQELEISLQALQPDAMMLLPRPYPAFHPFWFKPERTGPFRLADIEKIEIALVPENPQAATPYILEVASVWLVK
jgi:hypothetical protein